MIIYVFDDNFITTLSLPAKISGMYTINAYGKTFANIFAKDDKWNVQLANYYISESLQKTKNILVPYNLYTVSPETLPKKITMIAIPKYEPNLYYYEVQKSFSIGSNADSDICYQFDGSSLFELLKINQSKDKTYYTVETTSPNFFISKKRATTGDKILSGDYVFYYGLKIIFLGNKIIFNNPNSKVKVKNNVNLKPDEFLTKVDKTAINYKDIDDDTPLSEYFFKSPRFNFVLEDKEFGIDPPPPPETIDATPTIMIIGPQLTMLSTTVLSMSNYLNNAASGRMSKFQIYTSYATIASTLAGTLLWPSITRAYTKSRLKKQEKKRVTKYTQYLNEKQRELEELKNKQKQTIIDNHPSYEQCIKIASEKTKELWQRSIDHDDFLSIRLGIGSCSSRIKINVPKQEFSVDEEDKLLIQLRGIGKNSLELNDVPITYNFTKNSINAVVGKNKQIKEFMDCVFMQMMTLHSYTDLKIIIYTKEPEKWDYLKAAPHCFDNPKSVRYFTTTVEELSIISTDLEKIFDARVADNEEVRLEDDGSESSGNKDYKSFRPYYLFYIDDMTSVRNVSLINKILHYKRNMGFSVIINSESISTLPSETSDFIVLDDNESSIMTSTINGRRKFIADYNKNYDPHELVYKLANIPMQVEKEKYELPQSLSFLEMYNLSRVEQFNSLERWTDNNPVLSLSVPVGIDQSGEIFKMDIHEKAYGPHGLVAGTTGSGKSEWIITYILSLAVNFSPNEVQFVLIDYKGGGLAMSFENQELGVKLPHLAGTITNLDKSEIFRSISAIESELKRRQAMFNDAREKLKEGSMNIYKYQQFYRSGMLEEPLSHLLIICDEFAELKQQQPEFMEQLISTSRIGRSLGIHLILATQKPSGVVNDQIWSNSKFKVCLKVQDKGDSNEILKKPDAAFLKQTGAFYLQVGNDDYYNLGQSAWAGAKYYPSDVVKKKIDDSVDYIDSIGRVINSYKTETIITEEKGESQGEELLNIVSYISNISKDITIKSKALWLENVKPVIYISDLLKRYSNREKALPYKYNIAIGEYDEPRKQEQGLLEIDLAEGNIAIMGQGNSGMENLVSTILWSTISEHTPYEMAFYIIDFGAETLKKFAKFPHVGEVLFQEDVDKIDSLFELIDEEYEKRKELLSDYNGSFEYYNKVSDKKLPLMTLIINGYDVFSESFPKIVDYLNTLFRDTPKCGITFILTAGSPTAIRTRQLQYFNHTILMQLSDDSQYRGITNCRRGLIPKKTPGRGICKLDSSSPDSYCEFQTAFITEEEKEIETIKAYANKCIDYYKYKVKQIAKIPDTVTSEDLIKYIQTLENLPIGINFYEKDITRYNITSKKLHLLCSKSLKDNIDFIYGLSTILSKVPNTKVRVVDMLNIFKKPIIDIKLFNESIDPVFAALKNDVLTRTETQDWGINLIIGAGQFKHILKKEGVDIFRDVFKNLPNSKKNIFILIDDYDKLRTIKLEDWYNDEYSKDGIWIGPGFANQSLLESNKVNNEDKKYDFEGMAFVVNNGEYKLIKTVLDGDE